MGRQLKYSRRGRKASVGSTGTRLGGCFGRTQAIFRVVDQEWRQYSDVYDIMILRVERRLSSGAF